MGILVEIESPGAYPKLQGLGYAVQLGSPWDEYFKESMVGGFGIPATWVLRTGEEGYRNRFLGWKIWWSEPL